MITSPHNPTLKLTRALIRDAKERRETGLFVVEGARLVSELLCSEVEIDTILVSGEPSNKAKQLVDQIEPDRALVEEVDARVFDQISATETSQGILAICKMPASDELPLPDLIMVADLIRDPGNLGTLLRSAVAAGAGLTMIPPETTDPFSPKALRAGMGAHFMTRIRRANWDEISEMAAGYQVIIASTDGESSVWEVDLRKPTILIIGGEADGVSERAKQLANLQVRLPMEGKIESLNAGVAGSLILYEALRQRSGVK